MNGYSYLTLEQRREIERMYAEGERVVDIAARLKRSAAAIYEELKRGYTQKPVKLYSWVLSLFARKGMKILDTHAGSGSSLIACYRQGGLDFVGFEIDEDYCRAANERLEQEQAQIRLFDLLEQEERKAQATLFTK